MKRRGFLTGILAAGVAPWVCTKAGILMPVRQIVRADPCMTATEVLARQREWLDKASELIRAEMAARPPIIDFGLGRCALFIPPDREWFKLSFQHVQ